ncbi:MIP/aquaporin family protein [Anoxybacteroides tepidamans]|uniref:MIP/aquaporin family protein n=1 Tax=Anoxybacteroides tepidamans TaxID=265948 RepID=UPI000481D499|nr:MIP/aquaporin family protein [Anoxybacillus tepidamans]
MASFAAELIGTALLIIFGGGVCAGVNLKKSFAQNSGWIVITFGWGMAVAIAVYAVGRFSGAHLNPAVTLALAFSGDFPWKNALMYILAQLLGAIVGAVIVFIHYLPHWKETNDPHTKLGVFATGPAIFNPFANLLSEMIGTFILVVGILAIGANKFTDGLNPFIIGFLVVGIGLSLGGTTGYAINPARDLGPRIAHWLLPIPGKGSSNWSYAWIPVVGPAFGGSLGGLFYKAVFLGKVTASFWGLLIAVAILLVITSLSQRKTTSFRQQKRAFM